MITKTRHMFILSPSGHISGLNSDKASFLKWLAAQSFLSHPNEACYPRLPTQNVQRIYKQHRNEADRHVVSHTLTNPRFYSITNVSPQYGLVLSQRQFRDQLTKFPRVIGKLLYPRQSNPCVISPTYAHLEARKYAGTVSPRDR
jgi:hypothetical protein